MIHRPGIKWVDDCTYTANYLSGTKKKPELEIKFLSQHSTFMTCQHVTPVYYVVRGSLDSLNSPLFISDTMWVKPK
jgi:hypothetical protein